MAMTPIPVLDRTSATFKADVDTFFGSQLPAFAAEANALQADVATKQGQAATSAANAATSEGNALASKNAAAISATNAATSEGNALASKNAAAGSFASLDTRYLGAKAVVPTLDNAGAALLVGALYWDTALPGMRSWNGSAWVTLSAATAASISNTPSGSIAATNVQAAINELATEKANLASPALTGTPAAPTAAAGTNSTQIATTAFVNAEIAADAPTKTGGGASGTWGIAITGNAATATSAATLTTARTINGVSFNGSASISINAAAVPNTPAGSIAATTVQAAINELDAEKVAKTDVISIANGGTGATSANAAADAIGAFRRGTLLGTVSQSAGVPTGAVIERGSNANGQYVRWADGTQICTRTIALGGTPAINLANGALFRSNADIPWTYPAAFIAQPAIGGAVTGGLAFTWLGLGAGGADSSVANFVAFSTVTTGAATVTALSAVGRWF